MLTHTLKALIIALFTLVYLIVCSIVCSIAWAQDDLQNAQARPTLTVTVVTPTPQSTEKTLEASGYIAAKETAVVTAQVSGLQLNRLLVDVGDTVTAGQALAEYDAATVENDIAQAQATLQKAQIAVQQASINAKRAQKLRRSKAISDMEHDNFILQANQAKADVLAAKAVLQNQQLRARYAHVTAPIGGLITERQAILGSVGQPGTALFTLIVDNRLEWQADVPDASLGKIRENLPVTVTLENTPIVTISGKVRDIDPSINSQTRQGKVYVSLPAHDLLRQGLFVRGRFLLGQQQSLGIPSSCLIRKDGNYYVFVVDSDKRVKQKKVQIGQLSSHHPSNTVMITNGLTRTDRVINSGVGLLKHGDLVHIVNDGDSPQPRPQSSSQSSQESSPQSSPQSSQESP